MAAGEGRRPRRRARPCALRPRRRTAGHQRRARRVPSRHVTAYPRGARPATRARLERRSRTDAPGPSKGSSRRRRSSRASTSRRRPRDRHARAPRRVRRETSRAACTSQSGRRGARGHDRDGHRLLPPSARDRRVRAGGRGRARDRPASRRRPPKPTALDELRELLPHPSVVAVGETGLDGHHGADTLREQRTLFEAQLDARRGPRPPGRDPQPRSERGDRRRAASVSTAPSSCTASRSPICSARHLNAATTSRSPATSRTRRRTRFAPWPQRVPEDRLLLETDSPYLAAAAVRGRPNEPMHVRHTLAALATIRGDERRAALERRSTRTPPPPSVWTGCEPGRRRRSGSGSTSSSTGTSSASSSASRRSARTTSCSRSGPGSASSRRSSPTVSAHVHADRARQVARRRRCARRSDRGRTSRSRSATRSTSISTRSTPPPRKLVANLPYNIATPLVAETLARGMPSATWCVMVQREVADRFFAEPGRRPTAPSRCSSGSMRAERGSIRCRGRSFGRRRTSTRRSSRSSGSRRRRTPSGSGGWSAARSATGGRRSRTRSRSRASCRASVAVAALAAIGRTRRRPRGGARARGVRRAHGGARR